MGVGYQSSSVASSDWQPGWGSLLLVDHSGMIYARWYAVPAVLESDGMIICNTRQYIIML